VSADEWPTVGITLGAAAGTSQRHTERAIFGFWVFLMSDAVIFALLFATYGTMLRATAGGPTAMNEFKIGSALTETLILLSSSFTFGMASIRMKYRKAGEPLGPLLAWLAVTLTLGLAFIGLEVRDFMLLFHDGAYPSRSGFLSAFFALVPLHGLHVMGGSLWLIVMMVQLLTLGCDARVRLDIERLGLFWHFLDIVWISIFSVVYLQGLLR
jgi:cytochrome o ubiquinol oxidase subunit 3